MGKRCIQYFIDNPELRAKDIKSKPSAREALMLTWAALNAESGDSEKLTKNRKLLLQYLIQIQHSRSVIDSINDASPGKDYPDCPTGAVGLLLDSLKILNNPEYTIQTEIYDSYARLNQMLNVRMNNTYEAPIFGTREKTIQQHKMQQKAPLRTYAHFLLESRQGLKLFEGNNARLATLNREQIDATVDEVLESWEPPQP